MVFVFRGFSWVIISIQLSHQAKHLGCSPVVSGCLTLNLREVFFAASVSRDPQLSLPPFAPDSMGQLVSLPYMQNFVIYSLLPHMAFARVLKPFDAFRTAD